MDVDTEDLSSNALAFSYPIDNMLLIDAVSDSHALFIAHFLYQCNAGSPGNIEWMQNTVLCRAWEFQCDGYFQKYDNRLMNDATNDSSYMMCVRQLQLIDHPYKSPALQGITLVPVNIANTHVSAMLALFQTRCWWEGAGNLVPIPAHQHQFRNFDGYRGICIVWSNLYLLALHAVFIRGDVQWHRNYNMQSSQWDESSVTMWGFLNFVEISVCRQCFAVSLTWNFLSQECQVRRMLIQAFDMQRRTKQVWCHSRLISLILLEFDLTCRCHWHFMPTT